MRARAQRFAFLGESKGVLRGHCARTGEQVAIKQGVDEQIDFGQAKEYHI